MIKHIFKTGFVHLVFKTHFVLMERIFEKKEKQMFWRKGKSKFKSTWNSEEGIVGAKLAVESAEM